MSLPQQLVERVIDRIQADHADVKEVTEAHRVLTSPASPDPVGVLRVWRGTEVAKVVYIGLTVPAFQLDSHMVFAFTSASSLVPHFTVDAVANGPGYAFHLDLIPKVDLPAGLAYIKAAYEPLTSAYELASVLDGLTPAALSRLQYALMSPWMLVHRADEAAFKGIGPFVDAYLAHWSTLVRDGLPDPVRDAYAGVDLGGRDRAMRAALFSPEVDPVWDRVARLLGPSATDELRRELAED